MLTFALLMIILAGSLHASAASSRHTAVSTQHFSAASAFIKNSQSSNWSGYAAISGHYTSVSASWTQPSVKCSSSATYSSFWVGLDGDGSNTVEQTGTEGDCQGRSPTYFAWYEMFPKFPVTINHPVLPGDALSASVTSGTKSSFKLVISDQTQGWTFQTTKTLRSAKLASAEAIAEAPSSQSGVLPLADFGTVNFSSTMVNGQSIGSFNPDEIVMVTPGGTVKAQPSALSGGTAFSVTWKHS
ncbi:MAG: hypothetical protein JOZ18_03795 [Chloroflexi bacterium]|nr:hypothetical protein [Chloroflexota bacterium]